MATTTMHFGPEWMRKQPIPASRPQTDLHPGNATTISGLNPTVPTPPTPSYSASVTSGAIHPEKRDGGRPLRYSKEEMIRIYQEGVKTGLGPEVEPWEGIIRGIAADPIGTKEMNDIEKRVSPLCCPASWHGTHSSLWLLHALPSATHQLFSGPLNSEVRRRQSTSDYLTPLSTTGLDRPKLGRDGSSGTSPMRERFGSFLGARRRDSGGTDRSICTDQYPAHDGLPRPAYTWRSAEAFRF